MLTAAWPRQGNPKASLAPSDSGLVCLVLVQFNNWYMCIFTYTHSFCFCIFSWFSLQRRSHRKRAQIYSVQDSEVKGEKIKTKYKRLVKGHSVEMEENGGNKGNTCLGSAGLLDLHDVNASWSRTCQESVISPTTKQVDVDSRWCEVWWYVNTVLEDPHHASKWVFSYWYFDYTDYSFGIISSQHLLELERTVVRCQT